MFKRKSCTTQNNVIGDDYNQGRNSVFKAGGRRLPISQDLEGGRRNMFVRTDLSLKYSQKRNFFHFFEQKNQNFQKQGGCRAPYLHPFLQSILLVNYSYLIFS